MSSETSAVEIVPRGPVDGRLAAPGSKSVTNRLLLLAALADGPSMLRGALDSDDTQAMREAVTALGATVTEEADASLIVTGTGGMLRTPGTPIDCRLSGTTMRFIAAVAPLSAGRVEVGGQPGLLARPIGALTAALRQLGADVTDAGGLPPVVAAGGGLAGGEVEVDASGSSQFASAVLHVAPYAHRPVTVRVQGAASPAYVALSAEAMRGWGADVQRQGDTAWQVRPSAYAARDVEVEYDASAAAHLLALAAATAGRVRVSNATPGTVQPDAALPALLGRMGAAVHRDGMELEVQGPEQLHALDVDLSSMPDQVTTVAALAALAGGDSRIRGVAVTRGHETDRLSALTTELAKLGVSVVEHPDGLDIAGGTARGPAQLDPHGDHRLAMAFAAIAACVPEVVITDAACVAKTYPAFWEDIRRLGVVWRPA